ncbi:MAG: homogentisate 1,2-dioxygenase [Anaerolineaceae bacterium]|nr:homogentisate 1,2-dioxygenase [Anaerolineaceae bacterium]
MPYYVCSGRIPHKRHTQFRKPDGGLYREEVIGLEGFSGLESILYHNYLPPRVKRVEDLGPINLEYCDFGPLQHRAFRTSSLVTGGDALTARKTLMGNQDMTLGLSTPSESMSDYYRNSQAYEVWFTHEGSGELKTQFGNLRFQDGEYLVIPYGTTWKMQVDLPSRFLVIEALSQIEPPRRYRNEYGQMLESAPYCERDIRTPQAVEAQTGRGEFNVIVKARNRFTRHILDHHPFDVVGWDGFLYPWSFNIQDFEPITGRIHQPPPVHQTFQGRNFVICSFVPRLLDYHSEGIPAPYNHSNVNSDEVIYYAEGNFTSRKGINKYDISLHPSGLPHGPQPGATEASIGKERTDELAVMVDTFNPLQITLDGVTLEKPYMESWLEGNGE